MSELHCCTPERSNRDLSRGQYLLKKNGQRPLFVLGIERMKLNLRYVRRVRIVALAVAGLLLIAAGLMMMTGTTPVQAAAADEATYVGAKECQNCHRGVATSHADTRHALTLQDAKPATILADFSQGEELRQVQIPGEDSPRAFTADDVALVVGSGRYVQRYLYQVDKNQYMVLPAEWNVTEQQWEPYTLATNWPDPAYDWNQNCAGCHTTGMNVERGRWKDDAVQCEACHGPGSIHVKTARDAGRNPDDSQLVAIRSAIVVSPDAQVCGQCHSQGTSTSDDHPYPVGYRPGQDLSTSFTLSMPNDTAHWRASGHAASQNMQYNEWLQSSHAKALQTMENSSYAQDSCLECHSADYRLTEKMRAEQEAGDRAGPPPDAVTLQTARYGVTCTSCHDMHGDEGQDYQLTAEPYALCVSCHADDRIEQVHNPVKAMFEGESVIDQIPGVPSKHFTQGVECTTCHMPLTLETGTTWHSGSHTMKPVMPGQAVGDQPDSCTGCHKDVTRDYMQHFVDETQSGILKRLTDAQVAIDARTDIPEWVTTALQFVSKDGSLGVHNYSYASSLLDTAGLELGIVQQTTPANISTKPVENPTDCGQCHTDEYRQWQTSPHANASLNQNFLNEFAANGRPSYCMSCHASGYDPRTEKYVFEGVVCSNCHYVTGNSQHPPGPVEVATNSAVCGQCHSGAHAPTYDEWLVSSHSAAGIDCVDCHTPHNNGLILSDVNSTCESCHAEAKTDTIHMGQNMTCVDCHMATGAQQNGVFTVKTGHTMSIDPGVCADCHGSIHLLSSGETNLSDQEKAHLETLQQQVDQLQTESVDNLNSGIVGGALGALVLALIASLIIRYGRPR
jgi:predicted CXXCH cytochrome family protein